MSPKSKSIKRILESRYGADGEKLIAELDKIAFGGTFTIAVENGAFVQHVTPDLKQRQEALTLLLAYMFGRPKQSLDIEHREVSKKFNPDRLTVAELQELERIATKAESLPEGVVDASFTEEPK